MLKSVNVVRFLAFGASLTEGFYNYGMLYHPYTLKLESLLKSHYASLDPNMQIEVVNQGLSGEAVLETMQNRLEQVLANQTTKFDWVLIFAGTNDTMRDQAEAKDVLGGLQAMYNNCLKTGAKVLAMTLPETEISLNSPLDKSRQELNKLLRQTYLLSSNMNKVILLDVEKQLPYHSMTKQEQERIWDDGLHLKPEGYDRLGEMIFNALKAYL
ncbi:unnamed protein product [Didymodactylos carnosus]|nr:unnamed protein product [Didymodactylos carnosus]CAF4238433.1 unnamed protein product [Didymodactylos carnosus]